MIVKIFFLFTLIVIVKFEVKAQIYIDEFNLFDTYISDSSLAGDKNYKICSSISNISFVGRVKKNHLIGTCYLLYSSGHISKIQQFDSLGNKSGYGLSYFDNGILKAKGFYSSDQRNGEFYEFYDNGRLKTKANYKNDLLEGAYIDYYKNGSILEITNFHKGEIEGEDIVFSENGNVFFKYYFKNGKPVGCWKEYNNEGLLIKEIIWVGDEKKEIRFHPVTIH